MPNRYPIMLKQVSFAGQSKDKKKRQPTQSLSLCFAFSMQMGCREIVDIRSLFCAFIAITPWSDGAQFLTHERE
jgi:hypothetical protein